MYDRHIRIICLMQLNCSLFSGYFEDVLLDFDEKGYLRSKTRRNKQTSTPAKSAVYCSKRWRSHCFCINWCNFIL